MMKSITLLKIYDLLLPENLRLLGHINLIAIYGQAGTDYANGGGSYANLFDAHPPFQIDGNFGALSGMAEIKTKKWKPNLLYAL